MNLTSLCVVRQWKSLTTNVKQDSKTEFSWFLWNWEADQEFLWIQDSDTVLGQYYADKEKLSQEFGIWNRGAIQWAWTINSVNFSQTQTDTAASPGKCWSQTSNESRFSFFFFFKLHSSVEHFFSFFVLFIAEQFFCSHSQTYTRATHTGWCIMVYHSVSVCETWWLSDDRGCV